MGKTSYDADMPKEKPELSDAIKKKMSGKLKEKNPINGTKFTIAITFRDIFSIQNFENIFNSRFYP